MLEIKVMGSCVVWIDRKEKKLARQAEKLLLVFLMTQGKRSYSREVLADAIRENPRKKLDEPQKLKSLTAVFSSLRKDLGGTRYLEDSQLFTATSTTIGISANASVKADVVEFEQLLECAKKETNLSQRLDLLQKAIALYKGEFLPNSYMDWVVESRARFSEQYAQAIVDAVHIYESLGKLREALSIADQGIQKAPYNDELHYLKILLSYEQGSFEAALRHYDAYQKVVAEVDRNPSEPSTRLVETIREFERISVHAVTSPNILKLFWERTLKDEEITRLIGRPTQNREAISLLEHIADKLDDEPKRLDALLQKLEFHTDATQYDRALGVADQVQTRAQSGKLHTHHVEAIIGQGRVYQRMRDNAHARVAFEKALGLAYTHDLPRQQQKCLSDLSGTYFMLGEPQRALDTMKKAQGVAKELKDTPMIAASHINLGTIYLEFRLHDKGVREYKEAIRLFDQLGDVRRKTFAQSNLASVYMGRGRDKEAQACFKDTIQAYLNINAKDHALIDVHNVAVCHLNLGELAQAEHQFERAIRLAQEVGHTSMKAESLSFKSKALRFQKKFQEAWKTSSQAIEITKQADFSSNDRHHLYFRHYEAALAYSKGKEARQYLKKAHDFLTKTLADITNKEDQARFVRSHKVNKDIIEAWEGS